MNSLTHCLNGCIKIFTHLVDTSKTCDVIILSKYLIPSIILKEEKSMAALNIDHQRHYGKSDAYLSKKQF